MFVDRDVVSFFDFAANWKLKLVGQLSNTPLGQKKGSVLKRCLSFRESYKVSKAKQVPALGVQFMM